MKTTDFIDYNIEQDIATVSFFTPKSNSLNIIQLNEISALFDYLSNQVKVILLRSNNDKVFCAGASFDDLIKINTLENGVEFFCGFAKVIESIIKCNAIVVGEITRKAVGGGVGIIAACDYTFVHNLAEIKLSELNIGIGPFVIEPVILKKIGVSATTTLMLNSDKWFSAKWGYEKGLYNEFFEDEIVLKKSLNSFLLHLSGCNEEALVNIKGIIRDNYVDIFPLLRERAKISASLLLNKNTQNNLKNILF